MKLKQIKSALVTAADGKQSLEELKKVFDDQAVATMTYYSKVKKMAEKLPPDVKDIGKKFAEEAFKHLGSIEPMRHTIIDGIKQFDEKEPEEFVPGGGKAQYGFDLTDIPAEDWKKVLKAAGVSNMTPSKGKGWQWHGKDILIVTANDPITGKYYNGQREDEEGYASYIGLEGSPEMVKKIAGLIKKYGNSKDEDPKRRQFI